MTIPFALEREVDGPAENLEQKMEELDEQLAEDDRHLQTLANRVEKAGKKQNKY